MRNFFDLKISLSTRSVSKPNSPFQTHPTVSRFTLMKLTPTSGHVGRNTGLFFGKRLDTILPRHRIWEYPDSPSTCYWIRCGFIFFHSWRANSKISDRDSLSNSPNACERKPYSERKSCRFKKYSETCARGLKRIRQVHTTQEKFKNAALFLRLGLPSTLIRHENAALFLRLGLPSTLIRHENAALP